MAKTVLIVEDNELNMKLFRDLLEAHGYQTVGTNRGTDALDLVRRHRPDLILMDIQLPEVSGLDVTRWIKNDPELRAIPIIAVTAFDTDGFRRAAYDVGFDGYLTKPLDFERLDKLIRDSLPAKPAIQIEAEDEENHTVVLDKKIA